MSDRDAGDATPTRGGFTAQDSQPPQIRESEVDRVGQARYSGLWHVLSRVLWLAFGLVILLWLLDAVKIVLLAFMFGLVAAIALNVPVTWLEDRRLPRVVGTLITMLAVGIVVVALAWLIAPRVLEQASALGSAIPEYLETVSNRLASAAEPYPALQEQLAIDDKRLEQLLPSLAALVATVGSYSLTLLTFVIFLVTVTAMTIYMVISPRPLLNGLITATPEGHRAPMERALARSSQMVVGWIWANIVVGAIEAVAVAIVLSLLDIPGAIVWAVLAFFAELVPKLGPYLMAIPPILVALAVDPLDALWVAIFYFLLNELMGDFVTPYVRGETMNIHPMILILAVLIMGSAFGLIGALIATPMAAFVTAFTAEFYLRRQPADPDVDRRTERILHRISKGG